MAGSTRVKIEQQIERALAQVCGSSTELAAPRRLGEGKWAAQVLASGGRRLAVVAAEEAISTGIGLMRMGDLPQACQDALSRYCERVTGRLRQHELAAAGDEVILLGRVHHQAGEQALAGLIRATLALCRLLAPDAEGLCDERLAQAYLALDAEGGDGVAGVAADELDRDDTASHET